MHPSDPEDHDCLIQWTPAGQRQAHAVAPAGLVLLSGSFNPLHRGHLQLAQVAADILSRPVAFELSLTNVDKPNLDWPEIERRAQQFLTLGDLWVTHSATFLEKSRHFRQAHFIIGVDTALRLLDARYHQNDEITLLRALEHFQNSGTRFLVAGRVDASGNWVQLSDLSIPPAFRDLFHEIPAEKFRVDLSSTALRASP